MDDVGRLGAAGPKTRGWFRGRFDPSGRRLRLFPSPSEGLDGWRRVWSNWDMNGFKLVAFGSVPPRSCDSCWSPSSPRVQVCFCGSAVVSMATHPSQFTDACGVIISISALIKKIQAHMREKKLQYV